MVDFLYTLLYKSVALLIKIIFFLNGGLKVKGRENIPLDEGVIIAPNHISYLDPPIIGAVLPKNGTFMARKGLFEVPVLRSMIRRAAFPVDRDKPQPSTIKQAVKRLKNKEILIMFPEGRRSDSGKLMEAKRGIGMIASISKATIIPTLIIGSDAALPVNAKWLKRAKITVVFGKPIYYTLTTNKDKKRGSALHEDISNTIISEIRTLKEEYGHNSR